MIEVESEYADRRSAAAITRKMHRRRLEESPAVQHTGEGVGRSGRLIDVDPILRQDQHDEGGADGVENDLDGEYDDPALRQAVAAVFARRERSQRHRQEEYCAVQNWNEDRGASDG